MLRGLICALLAAVCRLAQAADDSAGLPVIVQQPQGLPAVTPGSAATFAVVATGPGPLRYQWRRDGQALPWATDATLAISGVSASNSGIYAVLVTSCAGTVASAPAILTLRGTDGTVNFSNVGGEPVLFGDGTPGRAPLVVQLFGGFVPDENTFTPFGNYAGFLFPGQFHAGTRNVPTAGGGLIFLQVRAWDGSLAPNFDACAAPTCRAGRSPVFAVRAGGGTNVPPQAPASLLPGFQGFAAAPPNCAPLVITTQPASQIVRSGAPVRLNVVCAAGAGACTNAFAIGYRWFKDGLLIPGAISNEWTIASAEFTDAGTYQVLAASNADFQWSQPAELAIATPSWLESVERADNGVVQVSGGGCAGCSYVVQTSTNLLDWQDLATVTAQGVEFQITDDTAVGLPQRFYRLRCPP